MKICSKCKKEKEVNNFNKRRDTKDGLNFWCKLCQRNTNKKYYKNNKTYISKQNKLYSERNQLLRSEHKRRWRENNRGQYNAIAAKRRAAKLNATLTGFDREILEIYKNCPKGYHVDHIIPLQGREVSGLHVPWNLQYLTPEENLSKGNRLDYEQ